MIRNVSFIFVLAVIPLFFAPSAIAAPIAAKAVFVKGEAKLFPLGGGPMRGIALGTTFRAGDRIRTSANGIVEVEFDTGSLIRIDRDTSMTIKTLERDRDGSTRSIFGLLFGRVRSAVTRLTTKLSQFEYHTKAAICGVAGTGWVLEYNPQTNVAAVDVFKKSRTDVTSRVFMQGTDPSKTRRWVNAGQSLSARFGRKPGLARRTPPKRTRSLQQNIPFSSPDPHETTPESTDNSTGETKGEPKESTDATGDGSSEGEGASIEAGASTPSVSENVSISQISKKISKPRTTDPGQLNTVAGVDNQGTQSQGIIGETTATGGDVTPPVTSTTINVRINLK